MLNIKNKIYLLAILLLFAFSFFFSYSKVDAQNKDTVEPVIETTKTPNGTSIVINFPEDYSGRVVTTYDGKKFKTTTTPITKKELEEMNKQIEERRKAIQKLIEEQQKMFDLMWKSFWF
jgi:transcriptional accessory protein Tex/SPT6